MPAPVPMLLGEPELPDTDVLQTPSVAELPPVSSYASALAATRRPCDWAASRVR